MTNDTDPEPTPENAVVECSVCMENITAPSQLPPPVAAPQANPPRGNRQAGNNNPSLRDVVATSCGHVFHQCCLTRWFERVGDRSCPTCRQIVPPNGLLQIYPTSSTEAPNPGVMRNGSGDRMPTPEEYENLYQLIVEEQGNTQDLNDELMESNEEKDEEISELQDSIAEKDDLIEALENQITELEEQVAELEDHITSKDETIDELTGERDDLQEQLSNSEDEVASLQADVEDAQRELQQLHDQQAIHEEEIAELQRENEVLKRTSDKVDRADDDDDASGAKQQRLA